MYTQNKTTVNSSEVSKDNETVFSTFTKLTPLDLNNIRLDVKHTILTPAYFEEMLKNGPSQLKE